MRILGLDPSTVATGWALLDVDDDGGECVLETGTYAPPHGDLDEMLLAAYGWCQDMMSDCQPDILAIETPFYKLNARTLSTLAALGGVLRLAATQAGLRVIAVAPSQRCTALGLPGNATKQQVLYTVNAIYGLNLDDHNQADAVAIAAAAALRLRQEALAGG